MLRTFALAPPVEKTIQKLIAASFGQIPLTGTFFSVQYAGGVSVFTASLVLSIMVIPFIVSIARDTFNQAPAMLKESAYGVGSTRREVIRNMVMPHCKTVSSKRHNNRSLQSFMRDNGNSLHNRQ